MEILRFALSAQPSALSAQPTPLCSYLFALSRPVGRVRPASVRWHANVTTVRDSHPADAHAAEDHRKASLPKDVCSFRVLQAPCWRRRLIGRFDELRESLRVQVSGCVWRLGTQSGRRL